MDSSIILTTTYINAGIWSKQNKFIFQVDDDASKEIILNHKHAGRHSHAIFVKEFKYYWDITLSRSHKMTNFKKVKRLMTPDELEQILTMETNMSGETIRCHISFFNKF